MPVRRIPAAEVETVVQAGANIGEGPVWDDREGVLWWVDISAGLLHRFDPTSGLDTAVEVGEQVGAVALRAGGGLVLAVSRGFATFADGHLQMVAEVDAGDPGMRMNDGYCDPQGRFWAGTMAIDGRGAAGTLYRLDPDGSVHAMNAWDDISQQLWKDIIDTNLTGVWNTLSAGAPHLIANGGGSMIVISSAAGLKGLPFLAPYVAAKHGVVGLARSLGNELGKFKVRVNTVHPTGVKTPMGSGTGRDSVDQLLQQRPDLAAIFQNTLPAEQIEPEDVSNAVLFLASDESQWVTGLAFTVDAGQTTR